MTKQYIITIKERDNNEKEVKIRTYFKDVDMEKSAKFLFSNSENNGPLNEKEYLCLMISQALKTLL
jgi:hypothetical protein